MMNERTSDKWDEALRHRYFLAWFCGTVVMLAAAIIYRTHAGLLAVAVFAVAVAIWGPVASTFLRRAGRTSPWRSVPRVQDMPWFAARSHDGGTAWSRWAIVDLVLFAATILLIATTRP